MLIFLVLHTLNCIISSIKLRRIGLWYTNQIWILMAKLVRLEIWWQNWIPIKRQCRFSKQLPTIFFISQKIIYNSVLHWKKVNLKWFDVVLRFDNQLENSLFWFCVAILLSGLSMQILSVKHKSKIIVQYKNLWLRRKKDTI